MAPGRRCEPAQAGFSLVEILVALLFLVIVVTLVTRTTSNARKVQAGAYFVEQASAYAQSAMDRLAVAPLTAVTAGSDTVTTPLGQTFVRSWTVTAAGNRKQVEVTVAWTVGGREHDVSMSTVVK